MAELELKGTLLNRLYSEPIGLFPHTPENDGTIHFKNGVNFIFGKKDTEENEKESLNGIGKTMILEFIDFCLLSNYNRRDSKRLFKIPGELRDYTIVLELSNRGVDYQIRRSLQNGKVIQFGPVGNLKEYSARKLSPILCEFLFQDQEYTGIFNEKQLRRLVPFYLKYHKPPRPLFGNPIKFLYRANDIELVNLHFYLLGFRNNTVAENLELQTSLTDIEKGIKEVKKAVEKAYNTSLKDIEKESKRIALEIDRKRTQIQIFNLEPEYQDSEKEIDALTREIKFLHYRNYEIRKETSIWREISEKPNTRKVSQRVLGIYEELQEGLGINIKKSIDEAIAFRKSLSDSRKSFYETYIYNQQEELRANEKRLQELSAKRQKHIQFLQTSKALEELLKVFEIVSDLRNDLGEIEGRIKLHNDLLEQKKEKEKEIEQLSGDFKALIEEIEPQIADFRSFFSEFYNSGYPQRPNESHFHINLDLESASKVILDVDFPAGDSGGKTHGKTLIYDLAVLFNSMEQNLNRPRFLIHDGIFDSIDKAHFVSIINTLKNLAEKGKSFQYIVTIKEDGDLTKKFGDIDELTPEKIADEAILLLSPSKRLLGKDWD